MAAAAASAGAIHVTLEEASQGQSHHIITRPGVVDTVAKQILEEIYVGDLPEGKVGVVVEIMRLVLELSDGTSKSPAVLEGMILRVLERVFPDKVHPVRKHADTILWALRTAGAMDKEHFGGVGMQFMKDVPVEAVMDAMARVQRTANAAKQKLSAAVLKSEFAKELQAMGLDRAVHAEVTQLVDAGLVTEVVGMLKDDGELSERVKNQLRASGMRLAMQAGTAVAAQCAAGKCTGSKLKRMFCCCS